MKKLYKLVMGILYTIIALLILSTVGILLYAQFKPETPKKAEKETKIDSSSRDESVLLSTDENDKTEENESKEENTEGISEESISASENKELTIEQVHDNLCRKYSLEDDNLVYYDIVDIKGESYYGFYVVDSGGGTWDSLLVCDKSMNHIYLYDVTGHTTEVDENTFATINDNIGSEFFSETVYTTGTWEDVLDEYMTAMIIEKNRKKATSLTDPSYYYIDNGRSEKFRMHFVEDLRLYQEDIILSVENLDKFVAEGKWERYGIDYVVTSVDPYNDEYGVAWVDVYFNLKINATVQGKEEEGGEYYRISLRQYPEGWKVTWLAES